MAVKEMETLSDGSRLWVFESDRALEPREILRASDLTREFLDGWVAHGSNLAAACDVVHDRFLLVAVDEDTAAASGCSIDALTRFIKQLEGDLGLALLDRNSITYRDGDAITRVTRPRFKELVAAGEVTRDTAVFDTTVTQLRDVRDGDWERPAKDSWHSTYFKP